ncbi:MAG: TlyA family RNA methyltransferase [Pelolinea sp.]|nr:TlyA family RNA methyltransferase [Pelolinea sp.]
MKKQRIDILLVNSGIVESRNKAQRMVMAGEVEVEGQLVHKPSELFAPHCNISLRSKPKYVSRGGLKLEKAIKEFQIDDIEGMICVDIGASTGGFTDCLLQNGAKKVYSIDVGFGQLHQSLRDDPRVVEMERVNVKNVVSIPDPVDLVTVDVSFISLKRVLPIIKLWANKKIITVIALIKPQFEVGRILAAKGKGVVRDKTERDKVVEGILSFAKDEGFDALSVTESPITGPKGNVEFLAYLLFDPTKTE